MGPELLRPFHLSMKAGSDDPLILSRASRLWASLVSLDSFLELPPLLTIESDFIP